MNKKLTSKLCFLSILIPCLVSCGNDDLTFDTETKEITYKYTLVANNSSNYEILIPDVCESSEQTGAAMLQDYLVKSSGVTLPIVTSSNHDATKKVISFGNTDLFNQSGITVDKSKLNYDGYAFNTKNENIFITGGSGQNSYAYSGLELLHILINFEGYCDAEIDYDIKSEIKFNDMNIIDAPAFFNRESYNSDAFSSDDPTTNELLLREHKTVFAGWGSAHTSFNIIGPNMTPVQDVIDANDLEVGDSFRNGVSYKGDASIITDISRNANTTTVTTNSGTYELANTDKVTKVIQDTYYNVHREWFTGNADASDQWCYSQEDLREQVMYKIIDNIPSLAPSVTHIFISQTDGHTWCTCPECTESNEKYNSNAAVCVKFINYIADKVKEYLTSVGQADRNLNVGFFSYNQTDAAPAKIVNGEYVPIDNDVILRDNAFIRIAPIYTDYAVDYYHENNSSFYDSFKGWQVLAKQIIVWNYNTNFSYYFLPFLPYNTIKSDYKFFKDCNVAGVMEQGAYHSKQTGWQEMKNYVTQKLQWNLDYDVNELINNFMNAFYKEAAPFMKQYFNEYRLKIDYINSEGLIPPSAGGIYGSFNNPDKCFTLAEIDRWIGLLDKCKDAIEIYKGFNEGMYTKLLKRIEKELAFPLYVKIFGYPSEYSEIDLLNLKKEFKRVCEENGFEEVKEGSKISALFEQWGI